MTTTAAMMVLVSMVTFLGVCVVPVTSQKSSSLSSHTSGGSGGKINDPALLRDLLKVFKIEKIPDKTERLEAPPEYMKKLYEMVAYEDGISKQPHPYDADIVRAIPDKASTLQSYYFFNVSTVFSVSNEILLEAEFHLFKLGPLMSSSPPSALPGNDRRLRRSTRDVHVIDLLLYEVLRPTTDDDVIDDDSLRLLHRRRIGGHYRPGWEVFNVSDTVRRWMENPVNNNGFLVRILSPEGQRVNGTHLRFAQRMEHHDSKQPVLILFTDDKTRHVTTSNDEAYTPPPSDSNQHTMQQTYNGFLNEGYRTQHGTFKRPHAYMSPADHQRLVDGSSSSRARHRRSLDPNEGDDGARGATSYCERLDMTVNFKDIGWDSWIIQPQYYNAYHCKGVCQFPLDQKLNATNHATVQSIVNALNLVSGVEKPCCSPTILHPYQLLYKDSNGNYVDGMYPEMVAAKCGCR